MVNCCASGDLRGDLHGEVGLVFAGEHAVGHLVENLRELGGVVLADGEDDGLADLAADRIAQGVFEEESCRRADWWPARRSAFRTRAA